MLQPMWKMVWQFLKKLHKELPFDAAIPLLGVYSKELKAGIEHIFVYLCTKQHNSQ